MSDHPILMTVHGFRDKSAGKNNVERLTGLKGVTVDNDSLDYGYKHLARVHFGEEENIIRMAKAMARPKVKYVLCHSNGFHFTLKACWYLHARRELNPDLVIFSLSGCSNTKRKMPPVKAVYNFYSRKDWALKFATLVPFSSWGRFGGMPYRGESNNVIDRDYTRHVSGHSKWFWPQADNLITIEINKLIEIHEGEAQ